MRKESLISCMTVAVLGALAFFFRWVQVNNSFEAETGLLKPGSIWTIALTLLCIAAVIVVIVLAVRVKKESMPLSYSHALRIDGPFFTILSFVLGLMMVFGSVVTLLQSGGSDRLTHIWGILGILTGLCFPVIILAPKGGGGFIACVSSLIPAAFYCVWLIALYRENSGNPVVWAYAIETLAIAAAVLGFYYTAGYPFDRPRPRNTLIFCLLGAFFGIAVLGGSHSLPRLLMYLSSAAMLLLLGGIIELNCTPAEQN